MTEQTTIVPSNPEDQKKIKGALEEISQSMIRMASERSLINEIKKDLKEQYQLAPKVINKMAKVYYAQNYDQVVNEDEEFQIAYETIIGKTEA